MIPQITVKELAKHLANERDVLLLDVREQWEYDHTHLDGCLLIPLGELPIRAESLSIPKDRTVVVYCHHGIRSLSGAAVLKQHGFTNVFSLHGGIDAWSQEVDPEVPRY